MPTHKTITHAHAQGERNIEDEVMNQVQSGRVAMKPRWYFVSGALLGYFGLVSLFIVAAFLVNILLFSLRIHGPMSQWRFEYMLGRLPWWLALFAIGSVTGAVYLLRRYDFSYRKNFRLIAVAFISSVILAGWIIDTSGLNDVWSRGEGPMRRFYRQLDISDYSEAQQSPLRDGSQRRMKFMREGQ